MKGTLHVDIEKWLFTLELAFQYNNKITKDFFSIDPLKKQMKNLLSFFFTRLTHEIEMCSER
jgi:hypothetical protein